MESWLAPPAGGGTAAVALLAAGLAALLAAGVALLVAAPRLPRPLRGAVPHRLRPRLTLAIVLVAVLPSLLLALVLAERGARQRAAAFEAALAAEAAGLARGLVLAGSGPGTPVAPPAGVLLFSPGDPAPADPAAVAALAGLPPADGSFTFTLPGQGGARYAAASAPAGDGRRVIRFAPLAPVAALARRDAGVAAGWLIALLVASAWLALSVADSVAAPLAALDRAVREIDPELEREPARAPAGAPREVAVVFEHLAGLARRLRDSVGQLQESLARGERLRSELVHVIETREQEIEGRTQQLKVANENLDRLSRLDALTGVANRRGLAELLDRAWRTALRDQQPVSVLMVDIDHFKAFNDSYGHQQGDSCIKAVANAIRHVAGRASDVVARYGGEEFVVVLGGTPLEGALQVGEQLRAAVEAMNVPHLAVPGRAVVTVSVGVTSMVPTRGSQPDAALLAADRAMYAAKEQGRNRVGYSSTGQTGLFQATYVPGDPAGRPS